MKYADATRRLADFRQQITRIRRQMRRVQAAIEPQVVSDYRFATLEGNTRLSQLFGRRRSLFVVMNMGSSCPYCTLWADGYNGIYEHLADRAAFVVASPDPPGVQASFRAQQGWRFPMVSHADSTFAEDMGYRTIRGAYRPGLCVFRRDAKQLVRVSDAGSLPLDDFSPLWHLFDLLPEGANGWQPKPGYRSQGPRRHS
jgi:predicted dithiol-disulfide oxidoreductase (DUF899 family)